ncbi:MAG: DoxX family protein [Terriglobus sp.]
MPETGSPSKAQLWAGWIISAIPGLMLFSGSFTALSGAAMVKEGMAPFGIPLSMIPVLGICELLCSVLYLIPRTAPIGAILMTAYMGGAVMTHARVGDPKWIVPVVFGILVWMGLLLRRPDLRKSMVGW